MTEAGRGFKRSQIRGAITLTPQKTDSLIVIAHGLGDTAQGFADVAEYFAEFLPTTKFVLPTAPSQPVTINGGMIMPSWYDIVGLDERADDTCEGIVESSNKVKEILREANEQDKVPYDRMILAGFSQGGALSLYTGLQLSPEKKLAGLLVLSGYLCAQQSFRLTEELKDTPVLHLHGKDDPLVQFKVAEKTREFLITQGVRNYKLKGYENLGHSVSNAEIEDALSFMKSILRKDPSKQREL